MLSYLKASTLKREAASILMIWLLAMSTYILIDASEQARIQILESFIYPIGVLFGGAFGADWLTKQTNIAGPATQAKKDGE